MLKRKRTIAGIVINCWSLPPAPKRPGRRSEFKKIWMDLLSDWCSHCSGLNESAGSQHTQDDFDGIFSHKKLAVMRIYFQLESTMFERNSMKKNPS